MFNVFLFLIIGVGKSAVIEAISIHAEKILRKSGHHPNNPRVLVCAPTGKAASIISKSNTPQYISNCPEINICPFFRWDNSPQRL